MNCRSFKARLKWLKLILKWNKNSILHLKSFTNSSNVLWKIPRTWNCYCFSHQVVSDSLWPHELQRTRLPCPLLSPRACSNHCPCSRWCHPTISSSVVHFSSCLQPFPVSRSFPMSWLFASGGQNIGASASASVLPINTQSWFPLELTGLASLLSKETLKSLL